jgi:single-strand DNA-binding protein
LAGSVNRVILVGRLGKDPEVKYTPSGQALATFSLATDETRKDAEGNRQTTTEWHSIVFWGKQAEIASEYLKKGGLIYVEGRLQTRSWEDSQGGGTRSRVEVVGQRFVMLSNRAPSGETPDQGRSSASVPTQPGPAERTEEEEDLPF